MNAVVPQGSEHAGGSGPLPAQRVLGATPVFKEPRLLGGRLFWLEQLPAQRGRTTLRMRDRDGTERELTPELDLRSRIHGYGGGLYCVANGETAPDGTGGRRERPSVIPGATIAGAAVAGATASAMAGSDGAAKSVPAGASADSGPDATDRDAVGPDGGGPAGVVLPPGGRSAGDGASDLTVVVVAEGGRSLWRLDLPGGLTAAPLAAPVRLTPVPAAATEQEGQDPALFADGLIDPPRQRWIGVCEQDGRDRLVAVPLAGGAPHVLWESPDFCGYAVLSPSGSHLAWVSWRQPCMPWDRSQLWLGRFDAQGELVDVRAIAGKAPGDGQAISVFQPLWAGPDLVVANDRSGWWNLELLEDAASLSPEAAPEWQPLLPMRAEFAMPQWVYGMRTTAWDGERLVAACCREGRWELGVLVAAEEPRGEADAAQSREPAADSATPDGSMAAAAMATALRPGNKSDAAAADHPQAMVRSAATGFTEPQTQGGLSSCSNRPEGLAQSGFRPERSPGGAGNTAGSPDSPAIKNPADVAPGIDLTPVEPPTGQPCSRGSLALHPSAPPTTASPVQGLRGPLHWQPIPLPFDDLAALDARNGTLVAVASGPVNGPGLLELSLQDQTGSEPCAETVGESAADTMGQPVGVRLEPGTGGPEDSPPVEGHGRWTHRPAAPALLARQQISRPEPLWFPGHGGQPTHAWYYPPRGGGSAASPLLLRGHSGPTGMARTGLSLAIQFWTSRGWGVVDVNYGGSTGFGRAYRERLDGLWGVVDVDDCLAAARAVVEAGRADAHRIAMEGSSASGFTVLAAMARGDTLRAGAIRYPVTDLTALAEADHRFEARYFDALVGPWPAARSIYQERSPLQQVDRIHAPLLFFHGLEDAVVPAQQSIAMVERLKARGVPVELQLFEGEGHGFRDGAVQRQVLERSEAFFRERFGLGEGG